MSAQTNVTTTLPASSGRTRAYTIVLWTVQVLLAGFLFFGAVMKLTGAEEMIALFDAIGIGQWFRYVTGGLQFIGAVLLVVPRYVPFGALLLATTMVGAVFTHLFVIGGSALNASVLLVLFLGIAWVYRGDLRSAIGA